MSKTNSVKSKLHYINNASEKVPRVSYSGSNESQSYSDDYIFHEEVIYDGRLKESEKEARLDREGFRFISFSPSKEIDFSDSENVEKNYYPEVEKIIKAATGASEVFVFDHTVRRGLENSNRHPAYHIHNDYTFETGETRVIDVLGEDIMKKMSGKRMVQINLWRSISGQVERDPLALMDATTLNVDDLVKTEIEFNDNNTGDKHYGEIFALKKNQNQKWYYYPGMTSDEALLIKGFDTDKSSSLFSMHTAFALPEQDKKSKPRQSIEARTFIFF